jgi:prophage regulatory protein
LDLEGPNSVVCGRGGDVDDAASGSNEAPNMSSAPIDPNQILRQPAVSALVGLSRASIYNRINPKSRFHDPQFPRPVPLNGRKKGGAVGWVARDVLKWIDDLQPSNRDG